MWEVKLKLTREVYDMMHNEHVGIEHCLVCWRTCYDGLSVNKY